ncbi:MAG TPA: tetratricopeptide repeat protein [Xanthobacteraceae bacterium]|nr:tetratricopeptide repeat protein [Xanthobacteraceae bacterium]
MNRKQRRAAAKFEHTSNRPGTPAAALAPTGTADVLAAGIKHHQAGRLAQAEACYRRVLLADPDCAGALAHLGAIAHQAGKHDSAVELIGQAIKRNPRHPDYFSNLGMALHALGKIEEAVAAYRQAIGVWPSHSKAYCNMGVALRDQGKLEEALVAFREAIILKPDYAMAHSNLLFCLNYDDRVTADDLFAAHREWDERHGRPAPRPAAYSNVREAGRRLRIGYVSPDFYWHSVSHFLKPLFKAHDRQIVEVFCYSDVERQDVVTAYLRGLADRWRVTVGLPDDEFVRDIRADGIDILVDLAGHTGCRLPVFAHRPAPIQVTWLGYPNTTGLEAIDYRLVDAVTDPVGQADARASESLVRLDGGFLCYGGPKDPPEPAPPPCREAGRVTFGSFNNPIKLSAVTLDAWATLLGRLPQARLLLKGKPFTDGATQALFLARLRERGVASERVELSAWVENSAHLARYHQLDIALDPFPYNGTTTTCEALWMGVPVVTLRGDRHAGRVGASLLGQLGLTDLVAASVEKYVEIAVTLAGDAARLDELRRSLRPRMAASPLCDGQVFARKIEAAFRQMWRRWCETPGDNMDPAYPRPRQAVLG